MVLWMIALGRLRTRDRREAAGGLCSWEVVEEEE